MYDYGARFYDPAIGRWSTPDPLAEMYNSCSPYAYVKNNPVRAFDPNGMYSMTFNGEEVSGSDKKYLQGYYGLADDSKDGDDKKDTQKEGDKGKNSVSGQIKDALFSLFFKDTPIDAPDDIRDELPFQGQKTPREVRGPDMFGFYVGGKFLFVQGGGVETGIVWVRDDKGGMFITVKGGAGGDVSAGGGIMLGWYQGSGKATLESMNGAAFYIDKSGNVIDIGASVDYNPTLKQTGRQWATISAGVSEGIFKQIPGGGGSMGVSGTKVIPFK